jgi:hypothetical protein
LDISEVTYILTWALRDENGELGYIHDETALRVIHQHFFLFLSKKFLTTGFVRNEISIGEC